MKTNVDSPAATRSAAMLLLPLLFVSCLSPDSGDGFPTEFPPISGTIVAETETNWETVPYGDHYQVLNNQWNVVNTRDFFRQRVFTGIIDGRETFGWQWLAANDDPYLYLLYPEIVYGTKPWEDPVEFAPGLPVTAGSADIVAYFDVDVTAEGVYNMAFSLWGYRDPSRPRESISHEVMIWNDRSNVTPAGRIREDAVIDGRTFTVYVNDRHADASGGTEQRWTYVAFYPSAPFLEGSLRLSEFLDYLAAEGLLDEEVLFSAIELGNEVSGGVGTVEFAEYRIEIANRGDSAGREE